MHALRRYWKAGACAHDPACVLMRARTENACSTRFIRSDGCAVCTCTYRQHAASIRRYFAGANDSAGVRMHNRMHNACAARFRTVTLESRVVSKLCARAMANMVLILICSCHAILRRAYELSAHAAGAPAFMRVRVWPHGAPAFARLSLHVLARCGACVWRCTCEYVAFAPPVRCYRPPYTLRGMDT